MDHYDPLGPKFAELVVLDAAQWPPTVLLRDRLANGTAVEDVHLSADAATLVLVAAWDPKGSINTSFVRVYDVAAGAVLASWTTGWVDAACLSPDGATLVLTTCDSENAIEVFSIAAGIVTQLANSSYPPVPGTFVYAETCQVSAAAGLWITFPLWWGGAINQTAVAHYAYAALPAFPAGDAYLPPTTLWLSPPISAALQDSIIASAMIDDVYVYTSWGGKALDAAAATPPTVHVFSAALQPSGAPVVEISTPASADPTVSGSVQSLDVARNGTQLLILCEGIDNVRPLAAPGPLLSPSLTRKAPSRQLSSQHANIGSDGGIVYLFAVDTAQQEAHAASERLNKILLKPSYKHSL